MDSTVPAAAIGVAGTVIVGVAGFGAAIWNTRKTLAADREHRLWDQRAKVYLDQIAALRYRQRQRYRGGLRPDEEHDPAPDWIELESRLLAFGSRPVITAVRASDEKHNYALTMRQAWMDASRSGERGVQSGGLQATADSAMKAAQNADNAVIQLIRTELQGGKPQGGDQRTQVRLADSSTRRLRGRPH